MRLFPAWAVSCLPAGPMLGPVWKQLGLKSESLGSDTRQLWTGEQVQVWHPWAPEDRSDLSLPCLMENIAVDAQGQTDISLFPLLPSVDVYLCMVSAAEQSEYSSKGLGSKAQSLQGHTICLGI